MAVQAEGVASRNNQSRITVSKSVTQYSRGNRLEQCHYSHDVQKDTKKSLHVNKLDNHKTENLGNIRLNIAQCDWQSKSKQ